MTERKSKRRKQKDQPPEWVRCPECGDEQADMGRGVKCENCGYGPMPSPSSES